MRFPLKSSSQRALFLVLAAIAACVFLPRLLAAIGAGIGAVLYMLAYIVAICLLPYFALWFFGFFYWFAKPYFRAWHINHIRNNRLLKEAVDRGKHQR